MLAKEQGWKVLLPGLVSQARYQSAAAASVNQNEYPVPFDEHNFQQYLLNFIVADDQVCFVFI